MKYMKIDIKTIFYKNIRFVEYSRSGVVYYTQDLDDLNELQQNGWKYNFCEKGFRVVPPSTTICDICECKKVEQYKNVILNLAYYKFLNLLLENGDLSNYIYSIINDNKIFYNDFYFHISNGPILETEIKIECSDMRIENLKRDMLLKFIKTDKYMDLYNECKKKIEKNVLFSKTNEQNKKILDFYETVIKKNSLIKKIDVSKQKYIIDMSILNTEDYDLILFIPFGCYKFINLFTTVDNYKKIMFIEFHVDKDKPYIHRLFYQNMYRKKVLIIDSVYSGKTLLYAKSLVEQEGGIPTLLGVYPKSKSVLNILDYALILDKVYDCKKLINNINFEKIYIETFGRIINDYGKDWKTSKIQD